MISFCVVTQIEGTQDHTVHASSYEGLLEKIHSFYPVCVFRPFSPQSQQTTKKTGIAFTTDGRLITSEVFSSFLSNPSVQSTIVVKPSAASPLVKEFSVYVSHEPRPSMFFNTGENYLRSLYFIFAFLNSNPKQQLNLVNQHVLLLLLNLWIMHFRQLKTST